MIVNSLNDLESLDRDFTKNLNLISREHLRIKLNENNDKYLYQNIGSNGSMVNKKIIKDDKQEIELKDGDCIDLIISEDPLLNRFNLSNFGYKFIVGQLDTKMENELLDQSKSYLQKYVEMKNKKISSNDSTHHAPNFSSQEIDQSTINKKTETLSDSLTLQASNEFAVPFPKKKRNFSNNVSFSPNLIQNTTPNTNTIVNTAFPLNLENSNLDTTSPSKKSNKTNRFSSFFSTGKNIVLILFNILSKLLAIYSFVRVFTDLIYPGVYSFFYGS